jgi:hypothetical protein
MLVTFRSEAWGSVTLFGDVAAALLKMMGHSGTVPSALLAADVPAALARLRKGVDAARDIVVEAKDERPDDEEANAPPPVSLRLRAYPLIELLSAAAAKKCDVMWDKGT